MSSEDHHVWYAYRYLRSIETESLRKPMPNYMAIVQQNFITPADRAQLVDYLIWLGHQYHYREQVPYLAISLVDRYLSLKTMTGVEELDLVGIAAFCLATEHYEDDPLDCTDLAGSINWSMPFGYRNFMQEVSETKSDLLNALGSRVGAPTIMSFLPGFVEAAATRCSYDHDDHQRLWRLSKKVANLALRDYGCCNRFLPSVIAASAVFLACNTIEPEAEQPYWTEALDYQLSELEDCLIYLSMEILEKEEGDRLQPLNEREEQKEEELGDAPNGTLVMIMFTKIREMISTWFETWGG